MLAFGASVSHALSLSRSDGITTTPHSPHHNHLINTALIATMFVKHFLLLAIVLVTASAQVSKQNQNGAIKVVKTDDDVYALATRWATSLVASWNTTNGAINTAPILGEYAPDGAMAMHSNKGGFSTGSQLLATVVNAPLTTDASRENYFRTVFLPNRPIPTLGALQPRLLSKDVASLAGTWSFTFAHPVSGVRGPVINARVTMVWKRYRAQKEWLLVEMHSSLLPQTYCDPSNPRP